jgi:hypothetical protein
MFIGNKFEGWNAKKRKKETERLKVNLCIHTRAFGNVVQTVFSKIQKIFC